MVQMWNENLCKQSQSVLFIVRVIRHSLIISHSLQPYFNLKRVSTAGRGGNFRQRKSENKSCPISEILGTDDHLPKQLSNSEVARNVFKEEISRI